MIVVHIHRVQLLLGHSNLNTMQVYRQFRDHDLREAIITLLCCCVVLFFFLKNDLCTIKKGVQN